MKYKFKFEGLKYTWSEDDALAFNHVIAPSDYNIVSIDWFEEYNSFIVVCVNNEGHSINEIWEEYDNDFYKFKRVFRIEFSGKNKLVDKFFNSKTGLNEIMNKELTNDQ